MNEPNKNNLILIKDSLTAIQMKLVQIQNDELEDPENFPMDSGSFWKYSRSLTVIDALNKAISGIEVVMSELDQCV